MRRVWLWLAVALIGATAHAQTISKGGIVNAANGGTGLARHSIASIYGKALSTQTCLADTIPLPTTLCGVTVKIEDGVGQIFNAPLYFVSPLQINLQLPLLGIGQATACIKKSCETFVVERMAAAIFEYERVPGVFDPVITHLDDTLVTPSSRAQNGETLILYATGIPPEAGFPAAGESAPSPAVWYQEPTFPLRVDSRIVPVGFKGLVPGLVGLAQFNFTLKPAAGNDKFPAGSVPLWIQADDETGRSKTVLLYVK